MPQYAARLRTCISWTLITTIGLALLSAFIAPARPAHAAAFTPGNIVIYRVGNGTSPLVNTGNPVFLDEYTPNGQLVQTIAMPTAPSGNNKPLIASGIAASEGGLNRSADGRYLVFAGYNAQMGGPTSLASQSAAVVNRVIGRVDAQGNIDTSTSLSDYASYDNPREVASDDGTRFWAVSGDGSSKDPPGLGGVYFTTLGSSTGTTLTETRSADPAVRTVSNLRSINIFGGQLYASSQQIARTGRGVLTVGTGLPTTPGQPLTLIPGHGTNPTSPTVRDFVMLDLNPAVPGLDTLYTANEYNGLWKYSLVGGEWAVMDVIHPRQDVDKNQPTVGDQVYRRITAAVNGNTVTIFATRHQVLAVEYDPDEDENVISDETNGELVRLVDTGGYGNAFSSTNPEVIIPARPNIAIRGVALAPEGPAVVQQPDLTVSVSAPAAATVNKPYTYHLTVRNIGNANASGVTVRFTLPAGLTFVSTTVSNGFTGSHASGVVTFSGGSIQAGGDATLAVTVQRSTTGTVSVPVGAAVVDPSNTIAESNEANNSSTSAVNTEIRIEDVDTTAPETTITTQPPAETTSTSASFAFTGTDDTTPANQLTFECSLDGAAFAACTSPVSYTNLAPGAHTFRVRAKDAAGNTDLTPASVTWTVLQSGWSVYLPFTLR